MESAGKKVPKKGEASSDEDEDDEDDLMTRRNAYVKRRIREAQSENKPVGLMTGAKNPVAAEKRRALIREFFKDIVAMKKCTSCSGYAIILQLSNFFCTVRILCANTTSKEYLQVTGRTGIRRSSESL